MNSYWGTIGICIQELSCITGSMYLLLQCIGAFSYRKQMNRKNECCRQYSNQHIHDIVICSTLFLVELETSLCIHWWNIPLWNLILLAINAFQFHLSTCINWMHGFKIDIIQSFELHKFYWYWNYHTTLISWNKPMAGFSK